jgi:hypothetical protein
VPTRVREPPFHPWSGGLERLVRDMSVPAESRTLPPPSDEEPDWEHVAAVAEANGCELLG